MNDVQKLIDELRRTCIVTMPDGTTAELGDTVSMRAADYIEAQAQHIREQGIRIEALTKDAQRLDHIASNARCDPKMDGQHVWWPTNFNHALRGPTLRAAIDASIKAKETGA